MESKIADRMVWGGRGCARVAIVPLCLYGMLILWLVDDHRRHRDHLEGILRSQAQSVIATVELGIANMGCKRRMQLPYIEELLRETVTSASAAGIALYHEGEELAKAGTGIISDFNETDLGERWTADHLLVGRRLRPAARCCKEESEPRTESPREATPPLAIPLHVGGGGNEDETLPAPTAYDPAGDLLVVAARRAPTQQQLRQAAQHTFALGGVGLFMVMAVCFWRLYKHRASRFETELLLSEERLKLTRERSLSAAGLAHETKNPLGMVRGMAQVLAEDGLRAEDVKEYAERIIEEVDRTVSRINEFLKYARPSSPKPEVVPLDAFFTKLKELISEGNGDLVTCDVDGGGLAIMADAGQLRQALFNLLANAVEAIRVRKENAKGDFRGRIALQVKKISDQRCAIVVRDNGCGITAEDLPQIFNPYFSRREDGSGLGLAIVRDIGRSHGWSIEVSSKDGRGATFTVSNVEIA